MTDDPEEKQEGQRPSRLGAGLQWAAVLISLAMSVMGAITPGMLFLTSLLIILAVMSELLKIPLSRVMWMTTESSGWRMAAAGVYALCVFASVSLMHKTQSQEVSSVVASDGAAADRVAGIDARIKEVEERREADRRAVVPGLEGMTVAGVDGRLSAVGRGAPSNRERAVLERQRKDLVSNIQRQEAVERAEEELEGLKKDRARAYSERPASEHVRTVQGVHEQLSRLSLILPLILEASICIGAKLDVLYNLERQRPRAPTTPVPQPERFPGRGRGRDERGPSDLTSRNFDAWVVEKWKKDGDPDGWVSGTQRGFAREAGVSSGGFVNGQLKRLATEGLPDYLVNVDTSTRQTRFRLVPRQEAGTRPNLTVVRRRV